MRTDVIIEKNAPGGGVLARFYRPGGWGLELFFARGLGIRPSKKLPQGFAGGRDGWAWN